MTDDIPDPFGHSLAGHGDAPPDSVRWLVITTDPPTLGDRDHDVIHIAGALSAGDQAMVHAVTVAWLFREGEAKEVWLVEGRCRVWINEDSLGRGGWYGRRVTSEFGDIHACDDVGVLDRFGLPGFVEILLDRDDRESRKDPGDSDGHHDVNEGESPRPPGLLFSPAGPWLEKTAMISVTSF